MNNLPIKIGVIIGSVRSGRFSEKSAGWISDEISKKEGVTAKLLDLKDFPLPFFEEPISPSMIKEPYSNPQVVAWTAEVGQQDGFIIVTPEYNHGYPAVLKNALDYVRKEWNGKAVGFVSHGSVGGARAVEQLRQVVIELQMTPIKSAIHIPWTLVASAANEQAPAKPELFESLAQAKENFLNQLLWYTRALKKAREEN